MGKKSKIASIEKIRYVQMYFYVECSQRDCANLVGVSRSTFKEWLQKYHTFGVDGLMAFSKNMHYFTWLKQSAARDYLNGIGSQSDICKKYQQVYSWNIQ